VKLGEDRGNFSSGNLSILRGLDARYTDRADALSNIPQSAQDSIRLGQTLDFILSRE
jgi:hypothetical protein